MEFPSFDFQLFKVPFFSPLQAQEYGATTTFQANTPAQYADFSLSQLFGIADPQQNYPYNGQSFFTGQGESAESIRQRLETVIANAQENLRKLGVPDTTGKCPDGETEYKDIFGFKHCGKLTKHDGQGTVGDDPTHSGKKIEDRLNFLKALPEGSGVFLIALVAIVFLFLFVRR